MGSAGLDSSHELDIRDRWLIQRKNGRRAGTYGAAGIKATKATTNYATSIMHVQML